MLNRLQKEMMSLKAENEAQQEKIRQLEQTLQGRHVVPAVSGKATAKPTSCRDINNIGNQNSGFYMVKGPNGLVSVFCDFSLPIAGN